MVVKMKIYYLGGELQSLEAKVQEAGGTILTPYITLDTPGKAQVQIILLFYFFIILFYFH